FGTGGSGGAFYLSAYSLRVWRNTMLALRALAEVKDSWQADSPAQPTNPCNEPAQTVDSPRISLTDNEHTVLRALRAKRPRLVLLPDLAADTSIDRKVCGEVVTSLIQRGLAERPSPRKGATITPAGEELLQEADAPRRPSADSR